MKTIFVVSSVGTKTKSEKLSCMIQDTNVVSFRFSVPLPKMETLIKENNEISAYTFDEKKVVSLRRAILKEKKNISGKASGPR